MKRFEVAPKLTASQENYLELIWKLSQRGSVRIGAIARFADVRLPSVTKAVNKLVDAGFVKHESYGIVAFTKLGEQAAQSIVRRDVCLFSLLTEVLDLPPDQAALEVCRIEHVISDEVLLRLESLVAQVNEVDSSSWCKRLHAHIAAQCVEHPAIQVGQNQPHPGVGAARKLDMEISKH